jgi:hypothetical protein
MYNRYLSAGDYLPVEEPSAPPTNPEPSAHPHDGGNPGGSSLSGLLHRLLGRGSSDAPLTTGLGGLLEGLGLNKLDKGDILLLFVLIYLFKESEDDEWLIILALVLLMGL